MKRKKLIILIGISISLLTISVVLYLVVLGGKHENDPKPEITVDNGRPLYVFAGDRGFILKGQLLDKSAKQAYNQLPDTLAVLDYGDELYCVNETNDEAAEAVDVASVVSGPNPLYSLFYEKKRPAALNKAKAGLAPKWKAFIDYLKLADAGKVEYAAVVPGSFNSTESMWTQYDFQEEFGAYFKEWYTKEIPLAIKVKLLEFFGSTDGSDYAFNDKDKRVYSNLVRYGNFNGQKLKGMACVLQSTNEYEGNRERLLIYAYNYQQGVYLLYSEVFYDKILIETVDKSEGETAYMDSEEESVVPYDGIRIKVQNQKDVVLVYDENFDKMQRYVQMPKSELERNAQADEEGE